MAPEMTLARWLGTVGALVAGLTTAPAWAQGNFEIQVYGSELTAPGQTTVELHTNSAIRHDTHRGRRSVRTQGAVHETLEITYGFTEWFETGFYLFTSIQPDSEAGSGSAITSGRAPASRNHGTGRSA